MTAPSAPASAIVIQHSPERGTLVLIPAAELSAPDLSRAVRLARAAGASHERGASPPGSRLFLPRSRGRNSPPRAAARLAQWLREAGFTVEDPLAAAEPETRR